MTPRTRRLLAALSVTPLAAAAIALLGAQAANAEDNSENSSGDGLPSVGQQTQTQTEDEDADPVGDTVGTVEDVVSDRRVKRDLTPVDWSR